MFVSPQKPRLSIHGTTRTSHTLVSGTFSLALCSIDWLRRDCGLTNTCNKNASNHLAHWATSLTFKLAGENWLAKCLIAGALESHPYQITFNVDTQFFRSLPPLVVIAIGICEYIKNQLKLREFIFLAYMTLMAILWLSFFEHQPAFKRVVVVRLSSWTKLCSDQ